MSDNEIPEVEVMNGKIPENSGAVPEATSEISEAINAVVDETVKLVNTLGNTLSKAIQDASNLMVVKVDADTRDRLDLLVSTGMARNRCKAATYLIQEGITANSATFERIQQTHERISELQKQMRSLVKARA